MLPGSMTVYVLSYQDEQPEGVPIIITTTRTKEWSRGLSPMVVGPVVANGIECPNMENAWQFSKVYEEHTDENGDPTDYYFRWRDNGYKDTWAHRYPMGKDITPLYSWWNGQKLGYIEARKKIYMPLYVMAVRKTDTWKRLQEEYKKHGALNLRDFDAYDHRKLGMSWKQVVHDPTRKMGHAFVLAMMLEGLF